MLKKLFILCLLLILSFYIFSNENIKIILTGIAIFLIGMYFMEDGFKLFSGGKLEEILEKFTSNNIKAFFTGFLSTSIVQSSSLISIIVISFLSIEMIKLTQAIAVVFGSNLGSTTTAWIVSYFGLKLKISSLAMPMIIFGVILRFLKNNTYKGFGNILLGLGFIFLGISYLKDGFDSLKGIIDLSSYSSYWILSVLFYLSIGSIMTIVIQSSAATMAIIITALAGGSILYTDALILAIGANIGTTFTAILGSLSSNQNGKRLAFSHLIFNSITAIIALILINQLKDLVDIVSFYLTIDKENYTMKLALFHTTFNLLGILVLFPFIPFIEKLSVKFIKDDKYIKNSRPIYLNKKNLNLPYNTMVSIQKETINLYENAQKAMLHAIGVHKSELIKKEDIQNILNKPITKIDTNLDDIYQNNLKDLYSEIIEFIFVAQQSMNKKQNKYTHQLKQCSTIIIKVLKETRDIQKNMDFYLKSRNLHIKNEYLEIKKELLKNIYRINALKENKNLDKTKMHDKLQTKKDKLEKQNLIDNQRCEELIRKQLITSKMATSLMNDLFTAYYINKGLLEIASILFINDKKFKDLKELDKTLEVLS